MLDEDPKLDSEINQHFLSDIDDNHDQPIITHAHRRKSARKSLLFAPLSSPICKISQSPVVLRSKRNNADEMDLEMKSTSTPIGDACCEKTHDIIPNVVSKNAENSEIERKPSSPTTYAFQPHLYKALFDNFNDFSAEKLAEMYRNELIQWDKLIQVYEHNISSKMNLMTVENVDELLNDRVCSKYFKVVEPFIGNGSTKYLCRYNSPEHVSATISNIGDKMLFMLEQLPSLLNRQTLYVRALKRKLMLKMNIKYKANFQEKDLYQIVSEFLLQNV